MRTSLFVVYDSPRGTWVARFGRPACRKAAAEAALAKDPKDLQAFMNVSMCAFMQSICVIGEGTLDFAKGMGYLDARELYPDIPAATRSSTRTLSSPSSKLLRPNNLAS